ncbi:MAG: hypothetical protein K9M36_00795 [Candidatus Pacebacteria bacterium]|nr:hypothetical protein [Candidatus Paceibacterota bacterium]
MKFKPNFEQYKKDQSTIDTPPVIKADFHFVINDIAKKIVEETELEAKDLDDLEIVYDMTQDLEKDLVVCIDNYRSRDIVTRLESLVTCDHFLTAHHNGPDSNEIKYHIIEGYLPQENFIGLIEKISIPEYTKRIIIQVYQKIKESKK